MRKEHWRVEIASISKRILHNHVVDVWAAIMKHTLRYWTQTSSLLSSRCLGTITGKHKHLPLTKIVATIGPASEQLPILPEVVSAGMRIMRLNFSHATYDEVLSTKVNGCECKLL